MSTGGRNEGARQSSRFLPEENHERDDERIDSDGFRHGDREDHGRLNLALGFGIAADRFQRLPCEDTETDTRTECAETDGERRAEHFCCFEFHRTVVMKLRC